MTTDEKNRLKQYFEKLLDSLEDGEIHVVALAEASEGADGACDAA